MTSEPVEHTEGIAAALTRQGAHWLDPWGIDLDEFYKDSPFAEGEPIDWGLLYRVNPDPWVPSDEPIRIDGLDWRIVFMPEGGVDPRRGSERLEFPSCAAIARVQASTLNEARRLGQPAVREVAALAHLLSRYLANQTPIWEGPLAAGPVDTVRFGDVTRSVSVPQRRADAVAAEFGPFLRTQILTLPDNVQLALYWYQHAWSRRDLVDRFAGLWWSALALVEAGRSEAHQRDRVSGYSREIVTRLSIGEGRSKEIERVISGAYDTRNELFHESRWSAVTEDRVSQLESVVSDLLKWEILARRT